MKPDKVAIIIRAPKNQWEGLRSSLGLGVEMIDTDAFVIGEVNMPADRVEGYKDNLEYLKDDLEAHIYSDNQANVEKWDFIEYLSLDDMARKISGYDLIIPF